MNPETVERTIIEWIHREPFAPFEVEMKDGQVLEIRHPRLAINGGGAGFIDSEDGALVDFQFENVLSLRLLDIEAMA